jgi:hypothetical protein
VAGPPEFPPDYATARDWFRAAAREHGWACLACPTAELGPNGEALSVDVAASPSPDADRVLVVSSGLHGVEGHFGSAVQRAVVERWNRGSGRMAGVRCVLVHALNAHGFAWSRRSDADNVDPNRNFLLDDEAYSGCPPAYARCDRLLNPTRPPAWWDPFVLRTAWAAMVHGPRALAQAIAGGQHDYPRGLFYGGHGPSRTHVIVRDHNRSWVGPARKVVHLDLHTGLGARGRFKLMGDYPAGADAWAWLGRILGSAAVDEASTGRDDYRARGSLGRWCAAQHLAPTYAFAVAEFGTYGKLRVLAGLREENQARYWSAADGPGAARARARLRELFCPASEAWRARVLTVALRLVDQAAAGLATTP